ncbi:hypothetical protein A2W14_03610 [Candidatus Gottesmanbacteria bacterium RBG_16_37_8]|uniref:Glycosyltransferase RgtA/B/C/D-like domain-containing protein n=1 Tax=Candidatus Gottesmanbacteria bacterium RBG_16_37_8 TaxID=1798371 RepID=A0A1F5YSK8_9BACT|nr:MAG: hypothetical protein A2W14_03610 [Candidatus Gottesmanbacteria bacterium RBG_16_37_8]
MKTKLFLILIFIGAIFVRFYQLNHLPGEWYGDISNVHEYVEEILNGKWPFYFFQSPGPVYHYLISPIALLLRSEGYLKYKIASVVVSILGIGAIFFLVKVISGVKQALMSVVLISFSFWHLVFSRLGNSQIIIPLQSAIFGYFIIQYTKREKAQDLLLGGVSASLGLYTYPQTFIFPVIYLVLILMINLKNLKRGKISHFLTAILLILIFSLPFFQMIKKQKDLFTHGYVGEKIFSNNSNNSSDRIATFIRNYRITLSMFHFKGDGIFRVNIPEKPMLDRLSGILLIIGILNLYIRNKKYLLLVLFITGVLLIPSSSPAINRGEIPSSSRTIAVIPFLYFFIAEGLIWCGHYLSSRKMLNKLVSAGILSLFMAVISYSNLKTYYKDYPKVLPDDNLASGKFIADYLDKNYGVNLSVYFGSCCWGEWGQPEPKAIFYQMKEKKRKVEYSHYLDSCVEADKSPAVVVIGPSDAKLIEEYRDCFPLLFSKPVYDEKGKIIFRTINID